MAKQRFLNNFTSTFIAAVKDAPSSGTPETELDYGVLRISDGAAGSLINPTDGDYYLLTAFKRSGSVESNIEVMRVTAVDNSTPGECRITVQRAQEGTSAKAFVAGDYLSLRITKGTAENFSQPADLATKEPVIAAPVSAPTEKYWRGDKTWRDFFTDVRAATLTGLSTATNAVVAATDTVLAAIGKLQAQVSSKFDKTGGDIFGNVNIPSLNGGQLAGLRNKIINGAMGIDQRNGGAAVVDSAGSSPYVVDRWQVITRSGATITAQRETSGGGSTRRHLAVTITSAKTPASTDQFRVSQVIEGLNVADLWIGTAAAKTVTLSFETCHSVTGTFSGALFNAAFNRSLVFTYTQNAADTWESKSITVPLDKTGTWATDNTAGLIVSFDYGSGSSFQTATVGSWQAGLFLRSSSATTMVSTAGAIFRLQAAQLEVGSVATPFEHRPHGLELDLARRYTRVYAATKSTADLAYEMRATPTQTGSGPYTYSAEL